MNLKIFLENEVKPALGCTEPGAVALTSATASRHLSHEVETIHVEMSGNIFKNGVNVGVPRTNGGTGNLLAAALGAFAGDPELGLRSLSSITMNDVEKAQSFVDSGNVTREVHLDTPGVFIRCTLKSGDETVVATTKDRHDNVVLIEKNGEVIFETSSIQKSTGSSYIEELPTLDMEKLWDLATKLDAHNESSLLKGVEMNFAIAKEGVTNPWALGIGYTIGKLMPDDDLLYKIKAYAGGAADVRMGGGSFPVMSSAGSGNHGITAIIPVALTAKKWGKTDKELAEALALTHLVTRYIKVYTGVLSPICGCAIAAGAGAAAGIVKLGGGSPKQAEIAVASLIASVMGMTCDGGKGSCALKVSTAAGESYLYALLALNGSGISKTQGLLKPDLKHIAQVLGELSDRGLSDMDKIMIDIIQRG